MCSLTKKCKNSNSIFIKDPGLFVNVCCVFSTKKVQIPRALYLSKTQDLVFKQGFVKKKWSNDLNIPILVFAKELSYKPK
jgi:hypothetical protein